VGTAVPLRNGADGDVAATPEQTAAMAAELRAAIEAGGMGFSSTQSFSHNDGDGKPVPSRNATTEELLALCEVVADYDGTTLEYITDGCLKGFTDEEIQRITDMSLRGQRAVNWNVLTVDSRDPGAVERQLRASSHAAEQGGRVVALTMPILVPMNMSLLTRCALTLIPGWDDILTQPVERRMELLRDPEVRAAMRRDAEADTGGSAAQPMGRAHDTPGQPATRGVARRRHRRGVDRSVRALIDRRRFRHRRRELGHADGTRQAGDEG
jgi:N-acyl-D-aspartate/D-glutamate deacylase